MISIFRPSTSPPKSSAAIFAAVSLPDPVMSAYRPDISRMPPSFSGGLLCAIAAVAASTTADAKTPDSTRFIAAPSRTCRIRWRPRFPLPRSCRKRSVAASAVTPAATHRALNSKHFPQNGMIVASTPPRWNLHRHSTQKPLSRNVVELQPDAVGIFEQQRIISRRPLILARRANDRHAVRTQEAVQLVNVGALAGAKTQMVQADAVLLERSAGVLGRRRPDRDRGAAADAIIDGVGIDDRLQPKKRQQLAVEFAGTFEIRCGQENMRDAVDFHRLPLCQ